MQIYNIEEVLLIAEKIEKNGEEFYAQAARLVVDPEGRRVLELLSKMEAEHADIFEGMRKRLPSNYDFGSDKGRLDEMFQHLSALAGTHVINTHDSVKEIIGERRGARELLELALRFERDSIAYFAALKALVPEDLGRREVDKLIEEEHRHEGIVLDALKRVRGE